MRPYHNASLRFPLPLSLLASLFLMESTLFLPAAMTRSEGQPSLERGVTQTLPQPVPAYVQGWFDDAKTAYQQDKLERALSIQRKVVTWTQINLDENHPFRGRALLNLGLLLSKTGRHEDALFHTIKAVEIFRSLVQKGQDYHYQLAKALYNLGERYAELIKPEQALAATLESITWYGTLAKPNSTQRAELAVALISLSQRYHTLAKPQKALDQSLEALEITKSLTRDQSEYQGEHAFALTNASNRYSDLGQPDQALILSIEAVRINRAIPKKDLSQQKRLALALTSLSILYNEIGRVQDALLASNEVTSIYSKLNQLTGRFVVDLAHSLAVQGQLLRSLGQYEKAFTTTKKGALLLGRLPDFATDNPAALASMLGNLAICHDDLGDSNEALPLAIKSKQIFHSLALKSPIYRNDLTKALINLSRIEYKLGNSHQALSSIDEAVSIARQLAQKSPSLRGLLAGALVNRGMILNDLNLWRQAFAPSIEAVQINRQLVQINRVYFGDLSRSTTSLAVVEIRRGHDATALLLLKESVSSEVTYLLGQLPLLPEGQRQGLVQVFGNRWQLPFSLAQQGEAGAALALFTRLNRQGLLQDIRRNQVLLARSGPHRPLFEQLTVVTNQLARPNVPPEEERVLLAQKEQLEQELYRLLPQVKPRLVEPIQVARRLPADGVLVEFQRYRSLNLSTGDVGPPRYLALVLTPKGAIHAEPLGDAAELEPILQNALRLAGAPPPPLTAEAQRSKARAQQALAEVRRRLLDPLLPHIGAARRWIVSPDGEIHRVPLAALPARDGDLDGTTLGEERELQVVTTGRELLEETPAPGAPASAALVMADPDYDALLDRSAPGAKPPSARPQTRSGDDLAQRWAPLTNFKLEGEDVAALLGTGLISGVQATTTHLHQAQGPRIVHIATHGFFLPDRKDDLDVKGPFQGFTRLEMPMLEREDPQLRSGIVLAGANHPDANPSDDGRLTALEATDLSLKGTELVTLSACSTGLGSQATGEGVYGLQRSLRVAGARSTLLTLWEVDDAATRGFMQRYYAMLKQGVGRAEALRQVQRQIRGYADWSHPHFWAAWQLSGDGGALPMGDRLPR
jgi:CHAT domain-containing protein/tetratricopeptide (TPR) repeat protein